MRNEDRTLNADQTFKAYITALALAIGTAYNSEEANAYNPEITIDVQKRLMSKPDSYPFINIWPLSEGGVEFPHNFNLYQIDIETDGDSSEYVNAWIRSRFMAALGFSSDRISPTSYISFKDYQNSSTPAESSENLIIDLFSAEGFTPMLDPLDPTVLRYITTLRVKY